MKHLVLLTGLSCTLKDSVADILVEHNNFIKFPDVNREYIKILESIAAVPETVNVTRKIPNIMLCSNRLNIYNTFLNAIETVNSEDSQFFVAQRTVLEHLFFDNQDLITLVDKDKLIQAELEFLSRFDKVTIVLLQNFNEEMLKKFYLTDEIRTSITKSDNKLKAYEAMREPYMRYISQLKPINYEYHIAQSDKIDSDSLNKKAKDIANDIISRL